MLRAFRQLGYHVEVVAGSPEERRAAIKCVKEYVREGVKFDFVYSESSTRPTLLTARRFYLNRPFLDFGFLRWLKKQSIPIGLFYRDIHWKFDQYRLYVPWFRRVIFTPFYWYDWLRYRQLVDHLFLPDLAMWEVLPIYWPRDRVSALPPGCETLELDFSFADREETALPLNLFYVGGVRPPLYDLRPMFDVVNSLSDITLTLCCRESEWEEVKPYYTPVNAEKIHIVHASGDNLATYYIAADLFGLIWEPYSYLSRTISLKVFETLGYGVPIVTTRGTIAAQFVEREGVGWVAENGSEMRMMLERLKADPGLIAQVRDNIETARERHTWQVRAQTVAGILTDTD